MRHLLLFTLLSNPAYAQNSGRPIAWDECVAIAAQKNPELASSKLSVESNKASYYGSFNGFMPRLNLSNAYNDGSANRWQAQGSASLNVLDIGRIADIKSASAGLAQAQANLRLASLNLRLILRQAFAQLLFSQKNAEVSKAIQDMREKSAELVSLRYNSGQESKGSKLRSQAQALQARMDLAQANRSLRTAQKSLNRRLGLDTFTPLAATGSLDTHAPPDLSGDLQMLLDARPDVALQQAVIQSLKAGLAGARSALWPSLSTSYTRSTLGASEFPSSKYSWTFAGILSYPLFGAGPTATFFAVDSAKKNVERGEQDLRGVRDQAIVDLETSWAGFAQAADQIKVQEALLEAARQRNDEADIRYASGLMSYDDWEIIASDRINSERQAVLARLNAVNAEAAWDKARGLGLGE